MPDPPTTTTGIETTYTPTFAPSISLTTMPSVSPSFSIDTTELRIMTTETLPTTTDTVVILPETTMESGDDVETTVADDVCEGVGDSTLDYMMVIFVAINIRSNFNWMWYWTMIINDSKSI